MLYKLHTFVYLYLAFLTFSLICIARNQTKVWWAVQGILIVLLSFIFRIPESPQELYTVHRSRSFYGTYSIQDHPKIIGEKKAARIFVCGNTYHGGQLSEPDSHKKPIFYYHEHTAAGQAFLKLEIQRVGIIGLGVGVLTAYGKQGQIFDLFELDPLVYKAAKEHFDYLKNCPAKLNLFLGDARLQIRKIPRNSYDLLVVDAFTSDAIPTHLITLEAIQEYFSVLKKDGVLAVHISNRYADLWPVLNASAHALNLHIKFHESREVKEDFKSLSLWVVMTFSKQSLHQLIRGDHLWKTRDQSRILWTDDFSNIWSVLTDF
jgi:spermidine synthase